MRSGWIAATLCSQRSAAGMLQGQKDSAIRLSGSIEPARQQRNWGSRQMASAITWLTSLVLPHDGTTRRCVETVHSAGLLVPQREEQSQRAKVRCLGRADV